MNALIKIYFLAIVLGFLPLVLSAAYLTNVALSFKVYLCNNNAVAYANTSLFSRVSQAVNIAINNNLAFK